MCTINEKVKKMNNEEKNRWVNATQEQKRLSNEYRDFLLRSLTELDVDISQLDKYTWLQLETMLMIDLKEQPRYAYDGEQCPRCKLVYRKYTSFTQCPRCSNKK